MSVIPPYSRSANSPMLAQTYMSSRSLTQGLDVINMEPSTPGVRTSVINSYLSNSANQNAASISNPNGLMASLEMDNTSVQGNSGTNPLSAAQNINSQALAQAHNQELTIVSPKIYSAIKNSIVQALTDQVASSQPAGAMSNVNALLSNQTVPGSMVDAAGAQINSFVNSLIFTVQSQTNLSPQEDLVPPSQPQPSSGFTLTSSQSAPVSGAWGGGSSSLGKVGVPQTSVLGRSSPAQLSSASAGVTDVYASSGNNYTPGAESSLNVDPAQELVQVPGQVQGQGQGQGQGGNEYLGSSAAAHSLSSAAQMQDSTTQNLSNVHGWVVGRVYSSVQSMIEMLAVTQSEGTQGGGINPSIAGLDSLLQSANSLFATMGLTSTVTASTLRTALEDIQRNLMSAPAQGQWINVVA